MNIKFEKRAADAMLDTARKAEASGNFSFAEQCYIKAADGYRRLAEACPERREEFTALADGCKAGGKLPDKAAKTSAVREKPTAAAPKSVKAQPYCDEKSGSDYELNVARPSERVSFDDIVGLDEAKETIRQDLIFPLKHPEVYKKYNLKIGGNTLLYGPPGTGKTTFAKAVACDVEIPFINVSCNSLVDPLIGATGKNVDKMFAEVRRFVKEQSTAVILFIDELDAIAQSRGGDNKTADETVPTIIKQLDGFDSDNTGIIILAATNIAEKLDGAVLDRFKSRIYIPLPNEADRAAMFEMKLRGLNISPKDAAEIDFGLIAKYSEGLSGRKISHVADKFMREIAKCESLGKEMSENHNDFLCGLIDRTRREAD